MAAPQKRSMAQWLFSRPSSALARPRAALALVVSLMLVGCGRETLVDRLPKAGELAGWTAAGKAQAYDRDSLFDLVDGQADSFLAYGFERAAVGSYRTDSQALLRITIWQLADPAGAYGLWTATRSGTTLRIGNDGDSDPGQRIGFWQDRYYVELFAQPRAGEGDLRAAANTVAGNLPRSGQRPAVMDSLPIDGLDMQSQQFFHEEISIQDRVWLGGQNLLGLSSDTDGAVARYEMGDQTAWLLVVQYPDAEAAANGLAALGNGRVAGVAAAETRGERLAAVFGPISTDAATTLLAAALGG